jgi:hypothetical protein
LVITYSLMAVLPILKLVLRIIRKNYLGVQK